MSLPGSLITRLANKQTTTTVSISRPTVTVDTSKSPVSTYATVASGIKAVVAIRSGAEAIRYGRESNRRFGLIMFPSATQDVRVADRIVHGSDSYDVQVVRVPHSRSSTDRLGYLVCEVEETE